MKQLLWKILLAIAVLAMLAGCGGQPAPAPTQAPPPPTEAPKPAAPTAEPAKPTEAPKPAAEPTQPAEAPQAGALPTPEANDYPAIYRWLTDAKMYDILPAGDPQPKEPYKLALNMIIMSQDYTREVSESAEAYAKELGMSVQTFDANNDAAKSRSIAETIVADKYDGMFIYATDPALGPTISKMTKDAGIVGVGADTPMTRDDYYYGVPSTYAGYIAGKYMFEQAKAKGWDPKDTVGIFMDISAFTACTMRLEGYKKALEEVFPDFPKENIVWYDAPYTLNEAIKSVSDQVTAHPAKNYFAAVSCSDEMTAGAARAFEAAGYTDKNALVSGQGGGVGPREELKKPGTLYASYTGYMPTCAGKLAVNYLTRILNGEDVPRYIQQYVVLLTKDTVDQYYKDGVEQCDANAIRGMPMPEKASEAPAAAALPTPEANDYPAIYRWLSDARKYDILPEGICEAKEPYKLGLNMIIMSQDYTREVSESAEAYAKELGMSVQTFDANADAAKSRSIAETIVADKYDGMFIYASDPALGPTISKMTKDAGIAGVGADTPMTRDDYYYGVPSTYAGYIAGKYMFDQMKAKGWDPKKTVGIFMDISAFTACTMRLEGYKKALEEVFPDFPKENIVWYDAPYTLNEAIKSVSDQVTAHPADSYFAAVSCSDEMTAGAARAFEAAGYTDKNALVSGQGGGVGPREELKKPGTLYASYTGYMPKCAGELAVNYLCRILNGEDVPRYIQQYVVLLTKDTVDQYYKDGVEQCDANTVRGMPMP
jgi:ABC-type sugar transport system substrate-binding protein